MDLFEFQGEYYDKEIYKSYGAKWNGKCWYLHKSQSKSIKEIMKLKSVYLTSNKDILTQKPKCLL